MAPHFACRLDCPQTSAKIPWYSDSGPPATVGHVVTCIGIQHMRSVLTNHVRGQPTAIFIPLRALRSCQAQWHISSKSLRTAKVYLQPQSRYLQALASLNASFEANQWLFYQNVIQLQPHGSKNPIVLYQETCLQRWLHVSKLLSAATS